jgi:chorismate-pyruvate lyase
VSAPARIPGDGFRPAAATDSMFDPLAQFYAHLQLPLPAFEPINGIDMPEPYRRLLVHGRDMTPTLEGACGCKLRLHVLDHGGNQSVYSRLVALMSDRDQAAVEMGAIRIFLDRLPAAARRSVLDQREPFGAILWTHGVAHRSRPVGYFRVTADALIADALRTEVSRTLYGRRNTIWNSSGDALADVVEILPPAENLCISEKDCE